jgi:hypothetical protein
MLKNKDLVEIDVKKEKEDNGLKVAWTVIAVQCVIGIVIFIFI